MEAYFSLSNGKIILFLPSERKCHIQRGRRRQHKGPTKKPVWTCLYFHTFFVHDTPDLSVTVVPSAKFPFESVKLDKAPSLIKHCTDSQFKFDRRYCRYRLYHFSLRGCFLCWQHIASHIIVRAFAIIKICVKAFYLALSALIGEMTDQHVW